MNPLCYFGTVTVQKVAWFIKEAPPVTLLLLNQTLKMLARLYDVRQTSTQNLHSSLDLCIMHGQFNTVSLVATTSVKLSSQGKK